MTRIVRVPFLIPTWAAAQVVIPGVIFVKRGIAMTPCLIAHELVHIDQIRHYGVRFPFMYVGELLRHGYEDNKFEQEARILAKDPALRARARNVIEGNNLPVDRC